MMVLGRTDSKRRRKDDNDVLQESPKRTKVHAQRKFAQGSSSLTSPALTPVKDKVKVNGITPPSDVLPVKRPNTEDFLTFLCFRGTKILPARLDFFSNASIPELQNEGGVASSSTSNAAGPSKNNTRLQEKNNSEKSPGSPSNVKPRNQPTSAQGRAVKALKKKYQEQRLAKQKKTTLKKFVQKAVKHQTRYGTRSAMQLVMGKKQNQPSQRPALLSSAKTKKALPAKSVKTSVVKVTKYKHKQLRVGLRSGGQLPPGSDIGIKSPVRRPRAHIVSSVSATPIKTVALTKTVSASVIRRGPSPASIKESSSNSSTISSNKNSKNVTKPIASSLSDFSSDDDQPLVKKSRKSPPLKSKSGAKFIVTKGKQISVASSGRPSRKTKEAATLYMEMLGKNMRSPEEYDDDTLSVESFPELPNTKKTELREKELKALAEKSSQVKEEKPIKIDKLKPAHHTLKKAANKLINVEKIDDRSKRVFLRNKAKTRMFKDKEKAKKILNRSRKTAAIYSKIKIAAAKAKNVDSAKKLDKKSNIVKKRGRKVVSKFPTPEVKKLSPPSLLPVKSKPSTSGSDQVSKIQQPQSEEYYSESDEEPLKVLIPKLPKTKKNVKEEEKPLVVQKDNKETVSMVFSTSPEPKHVAKRDKPKILHKKIENNDFRKTAFTEDKKEKIIENMGETKKDNKAKDASNEEVNSEKQNEEDKRKVKEKKVDEEVKIPKIDEQKEITKTVSAENKIKTSKKVTTKVLELMSDETVVKVPVKKCDIRVETVGKSKHACTSKKVVKIKKLESIQNKPPEEYEMTKKMSKKPLKEGKVKCNNIESVLSETKGTKEDKNVTSLSDNDVLKLSIISDFNPCLNEANKSGHKTCNQSEKSVESQTFTEIISKISYDSSGSKSKSDDLKTLQTCDNSNKININELDICQGMPLLVNIDKSLKSDDVPVLPPAVITNSLESVNIKSTPIKGAQKVVNIDNLTPLPVSVNKVLKNENIYALPVIAHDKIIKAEDAPTPSTSSKCKQIKIEDDKLLLTNRFENRDSNSNYNDKSIKSEESIPLVYTVCVSEPIKSEDVKKLVCNNPSDIKKVEDKKVIFNDKKIDIKIDKLESKEILMSSSLKKPSEVKEAVGTFITEMEPKRESLVMLKETVKPIGKLKNDLCFTSLDHKKLLKHDTKITSSVLLKNKGKDVISLSEEKSQIPHVKPNDDTKKPPTSFTGLLKSQTNTVSGLSEDNVKLMGVTLNDIKIALEEKDHNKIPNFLPKNKESLVIKSNLEEVNKPKAVNKSVLSKELNIVIKDSEFPVLFKDKTIVEGTIEGISSDTSKCKVQADIKSSSTTAASPGKKSVSDTWIYAFKHAKIPKPGQSSPGPTKKQKPFERQPFTSRSLKNQIEVGSGSKIENVSPKKDVYQGLKKVQNTSTNVDINNPLSVDKKGPFISTATTNVTTNQTTPVTSIVTSEVESIVDNSKNVIDPETLRLKEAEVEDIVRKYVGSCEWEKKHTGLRNVTSGIKSVENVEVFQSTVVETTIDQRKKLFVTNIIDKPHSLITDANESIGNTAGSDVVKPGLTFSNKPLGIPINLNLLENKLTVEKPKVFATPTTDLSSSSEPVPVVSSPVNPPETGIVSGKHHHLLPVEQTLKKLSQLKVSVSRKPSGTKQLQPLDIPTMTSTVSSFSSPSKGKGSEALQKSLCSSDVDELNAGSNKGHLNLLPKRKMNMSEEDINKWLNDSTSVGIEHTKNCGIFEKNHCECKPTFNEVVSEQAEQEIVKIKPKETKIETNQEEVILKSSTESSPGVENINLKESSKINLAPMEMSLEKVNEVNPAINVKSQSERKVSVTLPLQNKIVGSLPVKPDYISPMNRPSKISDQNKSPDEKNTCSKILMPPGESSFVSNLNKLKVSRGTNKMGDSENENSSRDPSEVSSPPPRDDLSSTDESPDKFVQPERRSIFQQRRSTFRTKLPISRSPSAFSPENESSVYAFEPDLPPTSTPFRRNKCKEGRIVSTPEEDSGSNSTSIAVQVNLDNEAVLECSTQTEADYDESEGHLFYIPLQQNAGEAPGGSQQVFQGVAVKLGTEGPDQRVIMRAKLVTKPPSTFASSSSSRPLVPSRDIKGSVPRPEQKVKPLSVSSCTAKPPVGTVQPTTRITNPPDITPPPSFPTTPLKRIPTPERMKRISQSPEITKNEITVPVQADIDKSDQLDVADIKLSKEILPAVATATVTSTSLLKIDGETTTDPAAPLGMKVRNSSPSPSPSTSTSVKLPAPEASTSGQPSTSKPKSLYLTTPSRGRKPRQQSKISKNVLDTKQGGPKTSQKSKNKTNANDGKGNFGNDSNVKLEDAPSFYPTEREFQDPLEYIEKIRPMAEKYGLCRIIPPANFKPECKVSDDMRFTAYNQYVHKMLNRWGPNVKEMLAIKKYLATQSIALTHPPWIGGMEVDLPKLYQTVQNCGGLKEVIEKKRWQRVADAMRIPKSAQDRVTKLDDIYCKFLLPYDTLSHEERTKLFEEVEKEWEKRISSNNSSETESNDSNDNSDLDECIVKGRNMALSGFYRIARNTMAVYFRTEHPSAHDVEAEFWNHVATRQSHVCVHSGSIDSGTNGYGFPTAKNSSTTRHPWNLKVLTNNSGSILRSLGPIMGVTVPTLHVGMVFTACCWYRDPHALPWIEYLHTGASKIWYGIPDKSSSEFRKVVNELVPNLCRDKTIWLASDTAMIPPNLLVKRGISISRTVQEPGQFILVFPKAFTSSICTGYLVSESVYFAQPSWLSTAQQIFQDISESCEPSMFSLERLLFSIATDARSHVDVLLQVLPMVQDIKENEIVQRKQLEKLGLETSERLPLNKRRKSRVAHEDDSDYECETCRANLFLSLVTNTHEQAVYCLNHAIQLLTSKPTHLQFCRLLYTYDMDELDELIEKIKSRIETKSQKKSQNKLSSATAVAAGSSASTSIATSSASQTPGSLLTKS